MKCWPRRLDSAWPIEALLRCQSYLLPITLPIMSEVGYVTPTGWYTKKDAFFFFFCSLDFLFWKIKSSIKSENKKKHGLLYSIRSNKIDFSAIVFASLLGVQVLQQHHYMLCTTCMPTNTRKHKQRPGLNSRSAHARKAESSRRTSLQSITCFALAACSKWVCQPIINMEQK